jgi:hypothetical protein
MPDDPRSSERNQWLLSPPSPDEAKIFVAIGKDAQLTPKLRSVLEDMARAFKDPSTHAGGTEHGVQSNMRCPQVHAGECEVYMDCTGVEF